jgi:hypothetical protein
MHYKGGFVRAIKICILIMMLGRFGTLSRATIDALWERWEEELSKTGRTLNDQPPLARAFDALPSIRVGALSPTYQGKLIPAQGELWGQAKASRTLVLHGEAKIVAGGAD